MIEGISLSDVASFSSEADTIISTNKQINLFYGHNGTGKTTIANLLQAPEEPEHQACAINVSGTQPDILVYNERFIERNFHELQNQPGIFTLSEGNAEAEIAIENAEKSIVELEQDHKETAEKIRKQNSAIDVEKTAIKDAVWQEKGKYERTSLEFCLKGSLRKDLFLSQVKNAKKVESCINADQLKLQAKELQGQTDAEKLPIAPVKFSFDFEENDSILQEIIVGSKESYLSQLIQELGNSDWVKQGQKHIAEQKELCPFCQQKLPGDFEAAVSTLFNTTYEKKIEVLIEFKDEYETAIKSLELLLNASGFNDEYVTADNAFTLLKAQLLKTLKANLSLLQKKVSTPSEPVNLEAPDIILVELNSRIGEFSNKIDDFNDRIRNKKKHLDTIKSHFWSMLKSLYDNAFILSDKKISALELEIQGESSKLKDIEGNIAGQKSIITENRAKITNIDLSIEKINKAIVNLGLQGFKLKKENEDSSSYRISRGNQSVEVYHSLSEGEKTLITFLYFLECCKGTTDQQSAAVLANRAVVIDDPISSLSHNYVYEMASLIQHQIIEGGFMQVFILTHNLFFFHELLKIKKCKKSKDFKKLYNLYRVTKNETTAVEEMEEKDIRNDYQSYWQIIKDCQDGKASPVVLPNMMRNILEYYFSFIHKQDALGAALKKIGENEMEYKPFFRYINRESHSDGINIHDFGEIDPSKYLEKFRLVFKETGFEEHFLKMMGLEEQTA